MVDYVRMRVYLCISTADHQLYERHSLACFTKANGANADGLFMQQTVGRGLASDNS